MRFDRSLKIFEEAARLIPGGSQTGSKRPEGFAKGAYPIYAKRAEGGRIEDVDGNTYIDLVMAFGPIILGHQYPRVEQAIREQLAKGTLAGIMFEAEVEAARLMVDTIPCADMVRFFKGGGEATAAAARTARAFTGRDLILSHGYHGWPDVWAVGHPLPQSRGVPEGLKGSVINYPYGDIEKLQQLFDQNKNKVAAVFTEVPAIEPDNGYLKNVKDLAHRNGALLIFDEVVTGFRLAPGGAQEYVGVTPDLAAFAKAMANGMPISAVAGREDVMMAMKDLLISITYGGEALSLAATVAALSELREKPVHAHLWKLGDMLKDGFNAAAKKHGVPFVTFGPSLMTQTRWTIADKAEQDRAWFFFIQEMAARGVLLRRTGLNLICYSHTEKDIRTAVNAADEVFAEIKNLLGTPGLAERLGGQEVAGKDIRARA